MKTYLTYGFIMTLASAFLGLGLYFGGFHADPAKLQLGQNIGIVLGIVIGIVCLLLGMREKRATTTAEKSWGYGSALGTGVMIALFGTLMGAVYNYAYFAYINPGFQEVVLDAQIMAMEEKRMKWTSTPIDFFVLWLMLFRRIIQYLGICHWFWQPYPNIMIGFSR